MPTATEVVKPPDTAELQAEISVLLMDAQELMINSPGSYTDAGTFLRLIKTRRAKIADTFNEPINAAHRAHKAMLAAKQEHDKPAADAERIVKNKMGAYQAEEERKRRVEENRLREIARKEEEDRRLAEAAWLEAQGRKEQAEQVISAPVPTPTVVVPSQVPKAEGISTRKVWKYRIVDAALIPREYLIPDEKKIGAHARSMCKAAHIPGIEFYSEDSVAATGY